MPGPDQIDVGILRRQHILIFLRQYQLGHGYMPNFREIGAAVGLQSSSTVQHHLNLLERDGLIKRNPTLSRAIRLVGKAS